MVALLNPTLRPNTLKQFNASVGRDLDPIDVVGTVWMVELRSSPAISGVARLSS